MFEIKTSETPQYIEKQIHFDLRLSKTGSALNIRAVDVQTFKVNDSIPYVNILRFVSIFRIPRSKGPIVARHNIMIPILINYSD